MSDNCLNVGVGVLLRTKVWQNSSYESLDRGIRYPVRVLHARGIETCQSCEGGEGHAYERPSIDLPTDGDDANGFAAVAVLLEAGLEVRDLALHWNVARFGFRAPIWRITLHRAVPERATEMPMFQWAYCHRPEPGAAARTEKP